MQNIAPSLLAATPPGLRSPLQTGIISPLGVTLTAHPLKIFLE